MAPTRTVNEVQAPRVASATASPATAGQPPLPGVAWPPGASVAAPLAQPALVASAPVAFLEWLPSFWSDGPPPAKKARAAPFPLGEALTPVPGRLVDKILEGEFVDFSELLPDNVELRRREAERGIAAGWFTPRTPMRRLTSLLSWVQAFAAFAAVTLSSQPQRSTELMAYLRLLASYPGPSHQREGLVYTACACASFSRKSVKTKRKALESI